MTDKHKIESLLLKVENYMKAEQTHEFSKNEVNRKLMQKCRTELCEYLVQLKREGYTPIRSEVQKEMFGSQGSSK